MKNCVKADAPKELLDKAISVPFELTDGERTFSVVEWTPTVKVGEPVTAVIRVIVRVEE